MARLEARNLVKAFKRRTVVKNVSFSVHSGEIVGLLGRNGAGKSTSFNMAVGFLKPNNGMVILNGEDVTRKAMYKRARAGLGYLPQRPTIFAGLTVEENIVAVLELARGRREALFRAEVLMEEFGIEPLRKQKAGSLSGGERRRLEIARALATEPALMLLDEPVYGVDPIAKSEILGLVQNLKQRGIGILITEHDVDAVLPLLDRCYIIHDGVVIFQGTPEEVVSDERVREEYLGRDYVYRPQRATASGNARRARGAMLTSERLPQISLDSADLGDDFGLDLPELEAPGAEPGAVFEEVRSRVHAAEVARRTSLLDADKTRAEMEAAPSSASARRAPVSAESDVVTAEPATAHAGATESPFGIGPPASRSSPEVTGRSRLLPAADARGSLPGSTVRAARPPMRSLDESVGRPTRPGERKVHTRVVTKAEALRRKTLVMGVPSAPASESTSDGSVGADDPLAQSAKPAGALPGDVVNPPSRAESQDTASESAASMAVALPGADPLGAAEAALVPTRPPASTTPGAPPAAPVAGQPDRPAPAFLTADATADDKADSARAVMRHRTDAAIRRYGTSPVQLSKDLPLDPVALSPNRKAELAPSYSARPASDGPASQPADPLVGEESDPQGPFAPSAPFVPAAPDHDDGPSDRTGPAAEAGAPDGRDAPPSPEDEP